MQELPLISALGCAVRIDTSSLDAAEALTVAQTWADAASRVTDALPAAHAQVEVPADGAFADRLATLSQTVTLSAIEARRGELWMLHAAAVADDEGRVVAVIGPSGRGKTTASRALGSVYGYVSDETVGIDATGVVHPYRKPLSVIEKPGVPKAQRAPGDLGLRALPAAPLRLAALVLLDRREHGPDEPVIEECDLGDVLVDLVEQTSYLADLPRPLQTIAAHAAAVGGIRRVIYREADTLPAALDTLFRDPHPVRIAATPSSTREATAETGGIYRGAHLDILALDAPDRLALLQPEQRAGATLRVLSGIGPQLWRAADGVGVAELVPGVIEAYGPPEAGDAVSVVAAAVERLESDGVLVRHPSWRVRDDVAWTGEDGCYVALPLSARSASVPVAIEGSAGLIWAALTRAVAITAAHLVERVSEDAGVDAAEIDADVHAFLSSLEAGALAERVIL